MKREITKEKGHFLFFWVGLQYVRVITQGRRRHRRKELGKFCWWKKICRQFPRRECSHVGERAIFSPLLSPSPLTQRQMGQKLEQLGCWTAGCWPKFPFFIFNVCPRWFSYCLVHSYFRPSASFFLKSFQMCIIRRYWDEPGVGGERKTGRGVGQKRGNWKTGNAPFPNR